ncbi:MAG: hypothetical protein QF783_07600, partial [Arenicellales bacterium]|nr:hypothetical protein [Arenicellales bacterium]
VTQILRQIVERWHRVTADGFIIRHSESSSARNTLNHTLQNQPCQGKSVILPLDDNPCCLLGPPGCPHLSVDH